MDPLLKEALTFVVLYLGVTLPLAVVLYRAPDRRKSKPAWRWRECFFVALCWLPMLAIAIMVGGLVLWELVFGNRETPS